ncbi:hypothetical protein ILUMI_02186 [Ignelater luminosus]|uniref:THAP-type domain-containing protein n=1 Tax=Ignelater luminosus TaxID=2038154 RepID=A0A8K0DGW2_IGNLU|nr:hypothetical protein ILUMI_02186 [Ignelater luminosus]
MPYTCCAIGCNSSTGNPDISLFRFPKDHERCNIWKTKIKNGNIDKFTAEMCYNKLRLCSKHFEIEMFSSMQMNRLKSTAIPTVFSAGSETEMIQSKVEVHAEEDIDLNPLPLRDDFIEVEMNSSEFRDTETIFDSSNGMESSFKLLSSIELDLMVTSPSSPPPAVHIDVVDYRHWDNVTEQNGFEYVTGYLARKCCERHSCDLCIGYIFGSGVALANKLKNNHGKFVSPNLTINVNTQVNINTDTFDDRWLSNYSFKNIGKKYDFVCTGKTKKADNKLENITTELNINCDKAHDALHDVVMLDQVLNKLNITKNDLLGSFFSWDDACKKIKFLQNLPVSMKELKLLKDCASTGIRKKNGRCKRDLLKEAYKKDKYTGILQILGKDENGVVKIRDIYTNSKGASLENSTVSRYSLDLFASSA